MTEAVAGVDVFAWNPRRALLPGRLARWTSVRSRINNFGDLIGPVVVRLMLERHRLSSSRPPTPSPRLLSVGSILHFARDDDVVWGSGVNGKMLDHHDVHALDVRAVRGPLTARFLERRGIEVPAVYGDPALLLPVLLPQLAVTAERKHEDVVIVPNLNDFRASGHHGDPRILDPCTPLDAALRRIAGAERVVGSSLHGIIVADALGIPARLIASDHEPMFKYEDYYRGSGRDGVAPAESVDEALRMGADRPLSWSPDALLAAFPLDLWQPADARVSRRAL